MGRVSQGASTAVILNSRAGSIKETSEAVTALRELFQALGHDIEIHAPESAEGLADAARQAARRASIVVAAGGDGTVSSVATAIIDTPAALGVLPFGTRNHFAKDLGIPSELRDGVAIIAAGQIGYVDVGRVNDRLFVNNASIGVYPGVVETREQLRRQGYRPSTATAIAAWRVMRDYRQMAVGIDVHGQVRRRRTPFVVVGNNAYAIEGPDIAGRSRLDEGKLFVYLTRRTRLSQLVMLLAKGIIRRAAEWDEFEIVAAPELTISTQTSPIAVAADGEVAMMSAPLRFRACPRALKVVQPRR
ncbi:MAG TPA: diacylglycerol kinase family protein [Vicinamibacterales bacterium]|nr:diacylglycerol kinase family protein [Vicinamibacterales bacterium]